MQGEAKFMIYSIKELPHEENTGQNTITKIHTKNYWLDLIELQAVANLPLASTATVDGVITILSKSAC